MTKQRFYTAGRSGAWFEISPEQAERIRQAMNGVEWWQMPYAKPKATVIFPAESETSGGGGATRHGLKKGLFGKSG